MKILLFMNLDKRNNVLARSQIIQLVSHLEIPFSNQLLAVLDKLKFIKVHSVKSETQNFTMNSRMLKKVRELYLLIVMVDTLNTWSIFSAMTSNMQFSIVLNKKASSNLSYNSGAFHSINLRKLRKPKMRINHRKMEITKYLMNIPN